MPNPNHKESRRQKSGKNKNTDNGFDRNCDNSKAPISRKINKNDGKQEKLCPSSCTVIGKDVPRSSSAGEKRCPESCKEKHNSMFKKHYEKFDDEVIVQHEHSEVALSKMRATSTSFIVPVEKRKVTYKIYKDLESARKELKFSDDLNDQNLFVKMITKPEPPQRNFAIFESHKEDIFLNLQNYDNDVLCTEYPKQILSAVNFMHGKGVVLRSLENPDNIALTSNKMLKICNFEDAEQTTCIKKIRTNVAGCGAILQRIITNCQKHLVRLTSFHSIMISVQQRISLMLLIELLNANKITLSDSLKSPLFYTTSERILLISDFCKMLERDKKVKPKSKFSPIRKDMGRVNNGVEKPNLLSFLREDETFKYWKRKLDPDVLEALETEKPDNSHIEDNAFGLIRTIRNKLSHKDRLETWRDDVKDAIINQWTDKFPMLINFVHQLKRAAEGSEDDYRKYVQIAQFYNPEKLLHYKKEKGKFRYLVTNFQLPKSVYPDRFN